MNHLVLARILHNGDDFLSILLGELTGPLGQRDVCLLQDNVGIPPTNTLCNSTSVNEMDMKGGCWPHSGQCWHTADQYPVRYNSKSFYEMERKGGGGNICLLQDNIGIPPTNTLNSS
jgi:hypothetical protein